MDSHAIREENAVLRTRLSQAEDKLRQLADALEQRNNQLHEWARLYEDLEKNFQIAQDAAKTQNEFLNQRDEIISSLQQQVNELRSREKEQANIHSQEAEKLRQELSKQSFHFIESLNKLNHSKAPPEQIFAEMSELLEKKDVAIRDLKSQFDEMSAKLTILQQNYNSQAGRMDGISQEKQQLEQEIITLRSQLVEARSGRKELAQIEELKLQVEKYRQEVFNGRRYSQKLKKAGQMLRDDVKDRDNQIQQLQENVDGLINQMTDYQLRYQQQVSRYDELREKHFKAMQNEKAKVKSYGEKVRECKQLEEQVKLLQEQIKEIDRKNIQAAHDRIKGIKAPTEEDKIRQLQVKVKQEVDKRLDAEELVFDLKEKNAELEKQIAQLKNQVEDLQGADVEPLVELIKDLRVEAISIDKELDRLIAEIPDEIQLEMPVLPEDLCDSDAQEFERALSLASQFQIENRELRILIQRLARLASTYHRVSTVIANYPVLSTEDIGTQEEHGNWILPANVEHLQRTVLKLHQILIRRKYE